MLTALMHVAFTKPIRCLVNRDCGAWRMETITLSKWRVLRTEQERGVGCWQENTIMRQQCPWCDSHGFSVCGDCRGTGNVAPHGIHDRRCNWCNGTGDVKCWHCDGTGELEVEAEIPTDEYRAFVAEGAIKEDVS